MNDQAIFKHILISIENGGEPVNDPQTLREVEQFKKLEFRFVGNLAFGFIPKSIIYGL